jgi:hypothetical protein
MLLDYVLHRPATEATEPPLALPGQVVLLFQGGGALGVPRMRRCGFLGGRETAAIHDFTSRTWDRPRLAKDHQMLCLNLLF